jgi:PAS domain S-box-containing protein
MRSRARAALSSMPGAVAMLDARGRIEYLNPAAVTLLGIAADGATGMAPEQLVGSANEADQNWSPSWCSRRSR